MIKRQIKSIFTGLYRQLVSPITGILWILGINIVIPLAIAVIFEENLDDKFIVFFSVQITFILCIEFCFRMSHRLFYGGPYRNIVRIPVNKFFVEPHPYIPFINKKHHIITGGVANYPLHKGKYSFDKYFTNNLRFSNGPDGSRDVVIPKPDGLFRINCIGASTTGNYIHYEGKSYSYPLILEKILQSRFGSKIEVNNFGQGGYNSADMLVSFLLQVADSAPDILVIYHGYNDITAFLTEGFVSDYSHTRRNLGESYWKFALAAKIPNTPFKFLNFLFEKWLPIDSRNSLLGQVSKGTFNPELDPIPGLETYERNLQYIIDVCKARNIRVILSTYCHFLYDSIEGDPIHRLFGKIVKMENDRMKSLASKNNLILVDNANIVSMEEKFFVDSIHFTPEGMHVIAENIAQAVETLLPENIKRNSHEYKNS